MNERLAPPHRTPRWARLLTLLLVLLLASPAPAAPAHADGVAAAGSPAAPETPILLGAFRTILGNQTAMIQICAVVAVVAIFWLTRSIRGG